MQSQSKLFVFCDCCHWWVSAIWSFHSSELSAPLTKRHTYRRFTMSNCEEYFVHIFTTRCYSRSLSAPGYSICGLDSDYGSFEVHWSRTFHSWHGKINFSPFEIVWAWRCVHVLNVRKTTVRWWILQRASTLPCLSLWAIYWKDNFNWNWKSQNERDMVCAKSAQSVFHLVRPSLLQDLF